MKSVKMLMGGVALLLAASGSLKAQTVNVQAIGIGSSALTLALGEAASAPLAQGGVGATCLWTGANVVQATDPTLPSNHETGNVWIAWTPTGTNCTVVTAGTKVYSYLQTDSVVGDRCLFNECAISPVTVGSDPTNVATAHQISTTEQNTVPAAVWNAINNQKVTVAGTDIRPEDAKFAMDRARTPNCATGTVNGSNYKALGYNQGDTILSWFSNTRFSAISFDLPIGNYTVTTVGAVPIVVATVGSGFNGMTNLTSANLAKFLDGTYTGQASDATVIIREPISGTYNTMEYNVPNTNLAGFTSQEKGNCNNVTLQPLVGNNNLGTQGFVLNIPTAGGGVRRRAIGTGESVSSLLASTTDALGYAFWSTANFKNAGNNATAKYVTIDGIDPLKDAYTNGVIPTAANNGLGSVTLSNVAQGNYPIWSAIRLVNKGTSALPGVTALANAAQNFVPSTPQPDFVKTANLQKVRSHFLVPGVEVNPNNGGVCGTEAGGDVGGVILAATDCTTGERK
jgi:hypothetical protein